MRAKVITNEAYSIAHGEQENGYEAHYRLEAVNETLRAWKELTFFEAEPADESDLLLTHSSKHLELLRSTAMLANDGYRSIGHEAWVYNGTWLAASSMSGGCIQGVESLLTDDSVDTVLVTGRSPGHHAEDMKSMGYCFLSNAAIAANYARVRHSSSVAIIDIDVHRGNGTESFVRKKPGLCYYDCYVVGGFDFPYPDYPVPPLAKNVKRIPLPAGTKGTEYLGVFRQNVLNDVGSKDVDLLLLSLGLDCMDGDPIGGFRLTPGDIRTIMNELLNLNKPLLITMEGGYSTKNLQDGFAEVAKALKRRER